MAKIFVSESIVINEKVEDIYAYLREFKNWPEWSPWLLAEPDYQLDFGNNAYSWKGKFVGSGRMEIVKETPYRQIDFSLEFFKPWRSKADVSLLIEEHDGVAKVTWSMESKLPFFLFWMKRPMTQFISMDYQRGLKMLRELLEEGQIYSVLDFVGEQEIEGTRYIGIERHCAISAIETAMGEDFKKLMTWVEKADASVLPEDARKPFSIYQKWDVNKSVVHYRVCYPLRHDARVEVPYGFVMGERPSCHAYVIGHTGAYRHLGNAWAAGMMRARARLFKQSKSVMPFEKYVTLPEERGEKAAITLVCFPLK
ncbi:SRPBCC family protein [Rubritalea spongiae]|uniref:SRPBCC family protein n=1 Tax=Rubritalea spongiae TaxID=430797 RepID=A0ABW5E0T1_9BACT